MGITTEASGPREDGGVNDGEHGGGRVRIECRGPEGKERSGDARRVEVVGCGRGGSRGEWG